MQLGTIELAINEFGQHFYKELEPRRRGKPDKTWHGPFTTKYKAIAAANELRYPEMESR